LFFAIHGCNLFIVAVMTRPPELRVGKRLGFCRVSGFVLQAGQNRP
jgi:hypothetical protein